MSLIASADITNMLVSLDGESVSIEGLTVFGIFQDKYEAQLAYNLEVDSSSPVFVCNTSLVASVKRGDALYRSGERYYVNSIQPDGTGLTYLSLSKDFE